KILAGAKAPAGAGDDDAADAAVAGGGIERCAQLAVHRAGEAVERLRAVQGERANAAGIADANERFVQGVSPLRVWTRNILDRPVGNSVGRRLPVGKRENAQARDRNANSRRSPALRPARRVALSSASSRSAFTSLPSTSSTRGWT